MHNSHGLKDNALTGTSQECIKQGATGGTTSQLDDKFDKLLVAINSTGEQLKGKINSAEVEPRLIQEDLKEIHQEGVSSPRATVIAMGFVLQFVKGTGCTPTRRLGSRWLSDRGFFPGRLGNRAEGTLAALTGSLQSCCHKSSA
ncbi:hypothetical protein NDU88_007180 [Pleurodeles waltl]|uniref:Uncharacterized protein n=1 Tax=Pleurodeles waltl TaxID=8319 RepID=A0AAV7MI09_PLEWA|nr:hypothetical protein NDU88_007180 [Pleurodeles waltl]